MKKNLILILISIIFALIIMEVAIRAWIPDKTVIQKPPTSWVIIPEQVWTERHPILGWYHEKNKQATLKKGSLQVEINTNSEGFRGVREYQKKKPSSTIRIVSLGDSFTFGWGVRDTETYNAQLESRYENLEVLNLGVAGYGVDQFLVAFRTIGKLFHPDYVFIALFPEDFWRSTRAFTDAGYGKPYFQLIRGKELVLRNVPVREPAQINYEQFPEVVTRGIAEKILMHSALYRYIKKKTLRLARDLGWIDPDLTEEWKLGGAILKQLVQEVKEIGAQPLIIIIPPAQWMKNTKPTSIQKSILRFGKRKKVDVIDLVPTFIRAVQTSGPFDFYIKDDDHWTAQGHSLTADVLAQYLEEHRSDLKKAFHADNLTS